MEKMIALRSLYRSVSCRSYRIAAANQQLLRHSQPLHSSAAAARTLLNSSSPVAKGLSSDDYKSPFSRGLGSRKFYSDDVSHLPAIKDPALLNVFKDLLAASWDELPNSVVHEAKAALSQNTDDQTGKEAVTNVFRAAEAVEEFGGMITNLKMELDDSVGMSGENVKPLSDEYVNALKTIYSRYITYLDAFGPEETYLRKKVETELGTKLIYLKMRCSGIGSEWGKENRRSKLTCLRILSRVMILRPLFSPSLPVGTGNGIKLFISAFVVPGLLLSRSVGTPIWNIRKRANQCESICRLAHLILYSDCRSLFWERLDFPGHILSKELNPRISENVTVIGSFSVFGIVFVGYLETGQMFRF